MSTRSDKPYVEDLGKATRQITIEAFVVGDDYIARGTALLAEIEKPGSGALIHPWLSEMTVTVTSVSELKFDTGLGTAYLTFVATEAGDLEFPATGADTQSAALEAADGLELGGQQVRRLDRSIDRFRVHRRGASGAFLDVLGGRQREIAKAFGFATGVADLASKGSRSSRRIRRCLRRSSPGPRAVEVGNDGDGVEPGGEAAQEPGFG